MQQVRDQVFDKKVESWSKACRKPARNCRKPGCKPGRKPGLQPGLQLARIMECGLYCVSYNSVLHGRLLKGLGLGTYSLGFSLGLEGPGLDLDLHFAFIFWP